VLNFRLAATTYSADFHVNARDAFDAFDAARSMLRVRWHSILK
jgi:hypothetical protein